MQGSSARVWTVFALLSACADTAALSGGQPIDAGSEAGDGGIGPRAPSACDDSTLSPPISSASGGVDAPIDLALGYVRPSADRAPDAGVALCESIGFNLDENTTCFVNGVKQPVTKDCAADAACMWGSSCINRSVTSCDEPGGIDNALGALLRPDSVALIPGADSSALDPNASLRSGVSNLLIRITGYNGLADDDDVHVTFYRSSGIASVDQPLVDAGGSDPTLDRWDGDALREWYVDPAGLAAIELRTASIQAVGYVTNHVLVVESTDLPYPITFGTFLPLERGRFVGELRRRGATWELVRGRLGGRISIANAIRAVASIPFSTGGQRPQTACESPVLMALWRERVCQVADLGDHVDQPCGSLSFGVGFVAVPAVISRTVWAPPTSTSVCDVSAYEACN